MSLLCAYIKLPLLLSSPHLASFGWVTGLHTGHSITDNDSMKRGEDESEPAAAAAVTSFAPEMMTQRGGWVGLEDACSQSQGSGVTRFLSPSKRVCKHLSPSLLYFVLVSGFHGNRG